MKLTIFETRSMDSYLKAIPDAVLNSDFFKKSPIDSASLKKIFNKSGSIINQTLALDVQPWQIAALLGMEEALDRAHGHVLLDLKDEHGFGVLHYYVLGGHTELVRNWLARYKPFVKTETPDDYRLLQLAVAAGNIPIIKLLKSSYAFDLAHLIAEEQTLLHLAVEHGQSDTAKYLIEQGVDPNKGACLPVLAAKNNHWGIYNDLFQQGIKLKTKGDLNAILIYAAKYGQEKLLKRLLSKHSKDPNKIRHLGDDLETATIKGGQFDIFNYGHEQGWVDLKRQWGDNKKSLLHIAAENGKTSFVAQVLEKYPNDLKADIKDSLGRTILSYASMSGDWNTFKTLLDKYFKTADIFTPDSTGATIVHMAAIYGQLTFLRQLTTHSGSECLYQTDALNRTALHYACTSGNTALIRWLASQGLSFSAKDEAGMTPLHALATHANKEPWLWKDLAVIAAEFGVEHITETRANNGRTVKDYIEAANQQDLLREINAMSRAKVMK